MIKTNNVNTYTINTSGNSSRVNTSPNLPDSMDNKNIRTLKDEFVAENKNNGLIEKFYNFCKNKTGLGTGSKKVAQKIAEFENGKASEKEVKNKLSDYKISQENAEQHFGDFASAMIAIPVYFKWVNFIKKLNAKMEVKSYGHLLSSIKKNTELRELIQKEQTKQKEVKGLQKLAKRIGDKLTIPEIKKFVSSKKAKVAILPLAMLLGGITKWSILKLNRIGSKEFKVENEKQLDKKELKKVKKELNHKRHKENFKNFCTGALNGLLAPITTVAGGIVGVPAYILTTSGIRFLTSKNDDKSKSFNNYFANFKNSIVLSSLFTLAIAAPAFKKAKYSEVLGESLEKVVKNLKDAKLKEPVFESTQTAYEELESLMLDSPNIKNILSSDDYLDEAIDNLTEENIFAVKFLQISNRGGELSSKLIENCPPSRSLSAAQREINRLLNSNKYTVSKLLGVGTVAESYLAKDQSGKEVCVKILKKGINAEKIQRDKDAFIELVNDSSKDQNSKKYLIKNIDNLADAISKEVDFENEMKAANKLRKSTKKANVVVPIEAKQGIYVMEKAPGISLDTLAKYYQYKSIIKTFNHFKFPGSGDIIYEYENKIKDLKAKSPDFNDFELSVDEIKILLKNYIEVLTEQFTKIDKKGKTLHADIHPGNIFINLKVLKNKTNTSKDAKLFTLIDTGNTIDLTKEQAAESLKLTALIKNGNVKDITKYVLNGAALPKKLTREEAQKLVENDLKTIFFDSKTNINSMNTDELFNLTNNILRKHNIIPNNSQLNLNKAKKSAENSLEKLLESFFTKKTENLDYQNNSGKNKKKIIKQHTSIVKDVVLMVGEAKKAKTLQESRNLLQMSPKEILANYRNANNLKTNSEEYLTYNFKQDIELPYKKGEKLNFE